MIILHRITTFVIAFCTASVFAILLYALDYALLAIVLSFVVIPILFARLLKWEFKRFVFLVFLSMPIFLLFSALLFFLFLESDILKMVIGFIVTICIWLYAESVFTFYHLPSSYQAYTLEFLSLIFSIFSAFFFTSGMYAMSLFMQLPVWIPALAVAAFSFTVLVIVLWVSKVALQVATRFAIVGAICMTEIYVVLSLLPTSFLSNAAGFAVILYVFLGLSRAGALDKLSKTVMLRYLLIGSALLLAIFATARWI